MTREERRAMFTVKIASALLIGYLFGSIPFGLLLTRLAGTRDLRTIGSGNIGATNVLRTGRKGLAAAALIASLAIPILLWFYDQPALATLFAGLTVLLWIMHRSNIAKLMAGTESKIGAKA